MNDYNFNKSIPVGGYIFKIENKIEKIDRNKVGIISKEIKKIFDIKNFEHSDEISASQLLELILTNTPPVWKSDEFFGGILFLDEIVSYLMREQFVEEFGRDYYINYVKNFYNR